MPYMDTLSLKGALPETKTSARKDTTLKNSLKTNHFITDFEWFWSMIHDHLQRINSPNIISRVIIIS